MPNPEKHAYFLAQLFHLGIVHIEQIPAVKQYIAAVGAQQSHQAFHKHGFTDPLWPMIRFVLLVSKRALTS